MTKLDLNARLPTKRLGHASVQITLDTYNHVAPGLQTAAAKSFDEAFTSGYNNKRVSQVV